MKLFILITAFIFLLNTIHGLPICPEDSSTLTISPYPAAATSVTCTLDTNSTLTYTLPTQQATGGWGVSIWISGLNSTTDTLVVEILQDSTMVRAAASNRTGDLMLSFENKGPGDASPHYYSFVIRAERGHMDQYINMNEGMKIQVFEGPIEFPPYFQGTYVFLPQQNYANLTDVPPAKIYMRIPKPEPGDNPYFWYESCQDCDSNDDFSPKPNLWSNDDPNSVYPGMSAYKWHVRGWSGVYMDSDSGDRIIVALGSDGNYGFGVKVGVAPFMRLEIGASDTIVTANMLGGFPYVGWYIPLDMQRHVPVTLKFKPSGPIANSVITWMGKHAVPNDMAHDYQFMGSGHKDFVYGIDGYMEKINRLFVTVLHFNMNYTLSAVPLPLLKLNPGDSVNMLVQPYHYMNVQVAPPTVLDYRFGYFSAHCMPKSPNIYIGRYNHTYPHKVVNSSIPYPSEFRTAAGAYNLESSFIPPGASMEAGIWPDGANFALGNFDNSTLNCTVAYKSRPIYDYQNGVQRLFNTTAYYSSLYGAYNISNLDQYPPIAIDVKLGSPYGGMLILQSMNEYSVIMQKEISGMKPLRLYMSELDPSYSKLETTIGVTPFAMAPGTHSVTLYTAVAEPLPLNSGAIAKNGSCIFPAYYTVNASALNDKPLSVVVKPTIGSSETIIIASRKGRYPLMVEGVNNTTPYYNARSNSSSPVQTLNLNPSDPNYPTKDLFVMVNTTCDTEYTVNVQTHDLYSHTMQIQYPYDAIMRNISSNEYQYYKVNLADNCLGGVMIPGNCPPAGIVVLRDDGDISVGVVISESKYPDLKHTINLSAGLATVANTYFPGVALLDPTFVTPNYPFGQHEVYFAVYGADDDASGRPWYDARIQTYTLYAANPELNLTSMNGLGHEVEFAGNPFLHTAQYSVFAAGYVAYQLDFSEDCPKGGQGDSLFAFASSQYKYPGPAAHDWSNTGVSMWGSRFFFPVGMLGDWENGRFIYLTVGFRDSPICRHNMTAQGVTTQTLTVGTDGEAVTQGTVWPGQLGVYRILRPDNEPVMASLSNPGATNADVDLFWSTYADPGSSTDLDHSKADITMKGTQPIFDTLFPEDAKYPNASSPYLYIWLVGRGNNVTTYDLKISVYNTTRGMKYFTLDVEEKFVVMPDGAHFARVALQNTTDIPNPSSYPPLWLQMNDTECTDLLISAVVEYPHMNSIYSVRMDVENLLWGSNDLLLPRAFADTNVNKTFITTFPSNAGPAYIYFSLANKCTKNIGITFAPRKFTTNLISSATTGPLSLIKEQLFTAYGHFSTLSMGYVDKVILFRFTTSDTNKMLRMAMSTINTFPVPFQKNTFATVKKNKVARFTPGVDPSADPEWFNLGLLPTAHDHNDNHVGDVNIELDTLVPTSISFGVTYDRAGGGVTIDGLEYYSTSMTSDTSAAVIEIVVKVNADAVDPDAFATIRWVANGTIHGRRYPIEDEYSWVPSDVAPFVNCNTHGCYKRVLIYPDYTGYAPLPVLRTQGGSSTWPLGLTEASINVGVGAYPGTSDYMITTTKHETQWSTITVGSNPVKFSQTIGAGQLNYYGLVINNPDKKEGQLIVSLTPDVPSNMDNYQLYITDAAPFTRVDNARITGQVGIVSKDSLSLTVKSTDAGWNAEGPFYLTVNDTRVFDPAEPNHGFKLEVVSLALQNIDIGVAFSGSFDTSGYQFFTVSNASVIAAASLRMSVQLSFTGTLPDHDLDLYADESNALPIDTNAQWSSQRIGSDSIEFVLSKAGPFYISIQNVGFNVSESVDYTLEVKAEALPQTPVPGAPGCMALFNGGQCLSVSCSGTGNCVSDMLTVKYTVATWFRRSSNTDSQRAVVLPGVFNIRFPSIKQPMTAGIQKGSPAEWKMLVAPRAFNDDQWHHLAVVFGGSYLSMSIDGVVVSRIDAGTVWLPHEAVGDKLMRLGCAVGNTEMYTGALDEFSIWSRALSTTEITSTLVEKLQLPQANLVLSFSFDNCGSNGKVMDRMGVHSTPAGTLNFEPNHLPLLATGLSIQTNESTPVTIKMVSWGEDLTTGAIAYSTTAGYRIHDLPTNGTIYQVNPDGSQASKITTVPIDISDTQGRVIYLPRDTRSEVLPGGSDGFADAFKWSSVDNTTSAISTIVPVDIRIKPINDPPVIVPHQGVFVVGDAVFTLANAFSVTDDSATETAIYTGWIHAIDCGTVSINSSMIGTNPTTQVNQLFANSTYIKISGQLGTLSSTVKTGIKYLAVPGRNQTCHVRITVNDAGYTGAGGPRESSAQVEISAQAVAVASQSTFSATGFLSTNPHEGQIEVLARDHLGNLRTTTERGGEGYPVFTMVKIYSPPGADEALNLTFIGSGEYKDNNVVLPRTGVYHIKVMLGGVEIAGSPMVLNVDPGPIYAGLTTCVDVPAVAIEAVNTQFHIAPRDRYNNSRTSDCAGCDANFAVGITSGTSANYTVEYDSLVDMYLVTFMAHKGETFYVDIRYNTQEISSCPETIRVYEVCPPGRLPTDQGIGCYGCPIGTYKDTPTVYDPAVTASCVPCPVGYANDQTGQSACQQCPAGKIAPTTGLSQCVDCGAGTYQPQAAQTACLTCPVRSLSGEASTSIDDCLCVPSSYFVPATAQTAWTCEPCPTGAVCEGKKVDPYAATGYWGAGVGNTFLACVPTIACPGGSSINAQGNCTRGYTGRMCADCKMTGSPKFYKIDQKCEQCPENNITMYLLVGAIGLVAFFALFKLQQTGVRFPSVTLMISFVQVTALFARFNLDWPPEIEAVFRYLSSFNFNLDLVAPECAVALTFYDKWIIKIVFPMVFVGLFALVFFFSMIGEICIKKIKGVRKGENYSAGRDVQPVVHLSPPSPMGNQPNLQHQAEPDPVDIDVQVIPGTVVDGTKSCAVLEDHTRKPSTGSDTGPLIQNKNSRFTDWGDESEPKKKTLRRQQSSYHARYGGLLQSSRRLGDVLTSTGMTLLVVLYTFLVTNSIDYFRCVTLPGSTTSWMATQPSVQCYSAEWMANLPIAISALLFYAAGVPITVIVVLLRARSKLGDSVIRHRFGSLYNRYNPRYYYWELVVMCRKVAIAMIVVVVADDVLWQSVMGLLLCFLFLIMQVFAMPFEMRSNNRLETVGLLTSYLTLFAGLLFFTANLEGGYSQAVLTWFIVLIIVGSMVAFVIGIVWELSSVLRRKWAKKMIKFGKDKKSGDVELGPFVSEEEMVVLQRLFPRGDRDKLAKLVNEKQFDRDQIMEFCRHADAQL